MTSFGRQLWTLLLGIAVVLAAPQRARAIPVPPPEDAVGWIWTPMVVYRQVKAEDLTATPPFVAGRTPAGLSPVTVVDGLGALVWIDAMNTIRVSKLDPEAPGRLRFRRLDTSGSAKALVEDPGVSGGRGTWFITQPTAAGSAWLIEADRPTAVSIEEPRPREGRLIWEHLEDRVLDWIDGKAPFPEIPPVQGRAAFRTRLLAHRDVAENILQAGADDEALAAAITAWQYAQALQELARIQPLVRPSHVSRRVRWKDKIPVDLPHLSALVEAGETAAHPYFRMDDGDSWQIEARGPGVLRITARAVFIDPAPTDRVLHVSVLADGREIDRLDVRLRPGSVRDAKNAGQPIPIYMEATTEHGDRISRPVVLSVPLLTGVHDYTVQVEGGPVIAKARIATRNYRTTSLANGRSPRAQMRKGLRHLRQTADPRGEIVRWLLLRLQFGDPGHLDLEPLAHADPLVTDWILAHALQDRVDPESLRASVAKLAARLPSATTPSPLELDLRWRLFHRLHAAERPDLATAVLIDRVQRLDVDAFVGLILGLPDHADIAPVAQALEIVARGVPLDDSLRRAHLELWRYTGWGRLTPREEPESWTWLAMTDATDSTSSEELHPGRLWAMPIGSPHQLDTSVVDSHTTVLSTVVIPPADRAESVALTVDGKRWETLVVDSTTRFETLLPEGPHQIQVDAPAGTRVFTSVPTRAVHPERVSPPPSGDQASAPLPATALPLEGAATPNQTAIRQRLWSLPRRNGKLRFDIEPPQVGTLLRLDLRAVPWNEVAAASSPAPSRDQDSVPIPDPSLVRVRTDQGLVRPVTLWPGRIDEQAIPEDAAKVASDRASMVFPLDPATTWIEIENIGADDLGAALYVRRWEAPSPPPVPEAGDGAHHPDVLEQIARLGRSIVQNPHDADALMQRAHLLLAVDAVGQAQQDHDRVLELLNETWDPAIARRLKVLQASIDRHRSLDAWAVHDPAARARPLLLAPALAEIATGPELAAWIETAALLRRGDAFRWTGDSTTAVARALAAVAAERAGQHDQAAFLWAGLHEETGAVAVGLAAAEQFRAALDLGQATNPAFAFGFVRALQNEIDSPRLRRLAVLARRRSRWVGLRYVDASAGMETLATPVGPATEPDDASNWLLVLSPPWEPTEDNVLRPGATMVVDLPAVATRFELFCQAVRGPKANHPDSSRTGLDVIVDGELAAHHEVASGTIVEHEVRPKEPTGHRVSFRLDATDPRFLCSVHRPSEAQVEPTLETRQWLAARPRQPVQTAVLGPTVLRLDTRHGAPHLRRPMDVFVKIQHDASVRIIPLTLPADVDPDARVASGPRRSLGSDIRTEILIPERGSVTVSIEPSFAQVMTRVAVRESLPAPAMETEAETPEPYPVLRARIADLGSPYWPGTPPIVLDQDVSEPSKLTTNRLGALEGELRVGRDDIAEFDQFRPRLRVRNTLTWRRELARDHLWIRAGVAGQWRDQSGMAGGVDGRLYGQIGFRRLRGIAGTSWWLEQIAERPEWAAKFLLSLDWPFQVVNRMALIPDLTIAYRYQSLTISQGENLREGVHPEVYSKYVEQHPLVFTPALIARIRPLQDQMVALAASTTPNSDFRSMERTDLDAEVMGIVDTRGALLFLYRGGYQASLRYADEDRSNFYVRNRVRAGLELTYLFIGAGRLTFGVQDSVYLSRTYAAQNVVELVLAFDLAVGRGIRDTSPMEMMFRNLYQLRWWKQGEEDDLL